MPNLQNMFKNDVARGAALGIGAAVVAVAAIPAIIHATDNFACIRPGATHTLTLTLVCGTQLETLQGTLSVSCALGHSGATGD